MNEEETIKVMQEQAQSFRDLDCHKTKKYFAFNMGWATLMIEKEPDSYELCPCKSGSKYKFCCKKYKF